MVSKTDERPTGSALESTRKRIRRGIVGTRRRTSAIAVLSAPITAVVTGLLVSATYGYSSIERLVIGDNHPYSLGRWVVDALFGAGPRTVALVGLFLLVAFAAGFAAKNSGLIPTITLVAGPIFGIGLARYGTTVEHFSPSNLHRLFGATAMHFETVGPVETFGTALFVAVLWGVPIGVLGFAVGTLGRRFGGGRTRRRLGGGASSGR
ncbi:hypothetical protein [Halopelagius longus]|uniref:DUF8071 domain-containing protein n=1 Tax=Halopelagius longus TaxID=1236180 RepID=A0A1H1D3E3_9EURY|nr:hypothetical protein [Halopelagius longus]RDI71150.1 hypothetical protein DWB78_05070 [Halopelagius longus]SDQ70993.1 hypothetical protein SAMN05216278_2209 [Halopelagius longus]